MNTTYQQFITEQLNNFDFSTNNKNISDMLKDSETIKYLKDLSDDGWWEDFYHSKELNHKKDTYYRVEKSSGNGYGGVGNGLYLGRDKEALKKFYDIEEENLPISEYKGKPNWLNLMDYSKFNKFKNMLSTKGINIVNSDEVGDIVIDMGYDGIVYYDANATGEEFVLFNLSVLEKIK